MGIVSTKAGMSNNYLAKKEQKVNSRSQKTLYVSFSPGSLLHFFSMKIHSLYSSYRVCYEPFEYIDSCCHRTQKFSRKLLSLFCFQHLQSCWLGTFNLHSLLAHRVVIEGACLVVLEFVVPNHDKAMNRAVIRVGNLDDERS